MTPDVFAAGGVQIDCVVRADGTTHLDVVGGNAVFAAAAARLCTQPVGLVGHVPSDFPEQGLTNLATHGLDLGGVRRWAGETATPEWFFHDADGGRTEGLYGAADAVPAARPDIAQGWRQVLARTPPRPSYADFRARHPVGPADVPATWWDARGMHIGATSVPQMLALAEAGRAHGLLVTLDPGPRAAELDPGHLDTLLQLVDGFMPSERELAVLRPGLSPAQAVVDLAQRARTVVVGKLGAEGVLVAARGMTAPATYPACPAVPRDPTGAGDSFCGAFLAGIVRRLNGSEAVRHATVVAAFAVESTGALAVLRTPRAALHTRLAARPGAASP